MRRKGSILVALLWCLALLSVLVIGVLHSSRAGLRVVNLGSSSASLDPNFQKHFGLYMSGNVDLDQTAQLVQSELDRAVQDYETNNPDIDIDSCMAG